MGWGRAPPAWRLGGQCAGAHEVGREDGHLTTAHGSDSRDGDMEAGQDMMGGEGLGPGSGVQVGSPPWVLVGPAMALEVQDGGKLWPSEAQDLIPPPHCPSSPSSLDPSPPAPCRTGVTVSEVPTITAGRRHSRSVLFWLNAAPLALPPTPSPFQIEADLQPASSHTHTWTPAHTHLWNVAMWVFGCCVTLFSLLTVCSKPSLLPQLLLPEGVPVPSAWPQLRPVHTQALAVRGCVTG